MTAKDDLSDAAKLAYQAFVDMSNSKAAHFRCLEAIDATYQAGGQPSLGEKLELDKLLSAHDKNVLAFKTAMAAITSDSEKQAVIELMS